MTETKFTPGPWIGHIGEDYFTVYNKAGSTVVPESRCDPSDKRDVADVDLIAAAPDMYAALKGTGMKVGDTLCWCRENAHDCGTPSCEQARAALAKAEGEE